jgi:anti-sigma-K factor RskA
MATPDEQWWDAQAGEYVLGTLRGTERDVFEKILEVDSEAQARVHHWERVFSVLNHNIKEIEPPDYILPKILARIQVSNVESTSSEPASAQQTATTQDTDFLSDLPEIQNQAENTANRSNAISQLDTERRKRSSQPSNRLWKSIAGLATAASIALAALLVNKYTLPRDSNTVELDSVTVIQNEAQQALWIVNVNAHSNTLQTIAISPPKISADQIHQLWIVKPNDAGVSSVGLLPQLAGSSTTLNLTPEATEATLFAVSLEPQGGSPEPVPTGPVLFTGSAVFVKTSN